MAFAAALLFMPLRNIPIRIFEKAYIRVRPPYTAYVRHKLPGDYCRVVQRFVDKQRRHTTPI